MGNKNKVEESLIIGNKSIALLPNIPKWVNKGINRRIRNKEVVLVSAGCPDYERIDGKFTYRNIGGEIPYIMSKHLEVASIMYESLKNLGVNLKYYVTLADTEFDLSLVVKHLTNGDPLKFLDRCESSCCKIKEEALKMGLPILSSSRFTKIFPNWFSHYHRILKIIQEETEEKNSMMQEARGIAFKRKALLRAMADTDISLEYCLQIIFRQWAQYATWGICAREVFGENVIIMNHSTPNLTLINYKKTSQRKERIPILELSLSTMPE